MTKPLAPDSIEELKQSAITSLSTLNDLHSLEEWRVEYLGRKGYITNFLKDLANVPIEFRREKGSERNSLKQFLEEQFSAKKSDIEKVILSNNAVLDQLDVTLPGRLISTGKLHPTTQVLREITRTFGGLGFSIIEGPEVEWDKYNFEMLNIPQGHPARDMWNTLWIDYKNEAGELPMLLRTHTSPMQARVMETSQPPIRVVIPGKCYRYEATDATHEWHFHQVEGLAVDEGITFADLKGTLYEFARRLFGEERKIRFRCDYFPFVEPGVDMSIDCFACDGSSQGCRICRDSGWIEIMGAGMVHPEVLKGVGYDTEKYTGFAFGLGPERIAMLKHGIDDIRHFYTNDLRFLRQF